MMTFPSEVAGSIQGVDLFCGAGGLTRGLEDAGIDMRLGIDSEPSCAYPYNANNKAAFLLKSVEDVQASDLAEAFDGARFKLLAGCAPCQPFSAFRRAWEPSYERDSRVNLLDPFSRLIKEVRPHFVVAENVPFQMEADVFKRFIAMLKVLGFFVSYGVFDAADYSVPQRRKRLITLASTLAPIQMILPMTPKGNRLTVRDAIGDLPALKAGEVCKSDPLHRASAMSSLNLKRMRASKSGGTWRDWPEELLPKCYRRETGKSFLSVYGRMVGDDVAPTLTTFYYASGKGRFGHPEQDRNLTLREGMLLQTFPKTYKFVPADGQIVKQSVGRLVGNAVPVKLGEAIGRSLVFHLERVGTG